MKNVLVLTRQLNELRMSNSELTLKEFREEIKKFIGYSMFYNLLIDEGYAHAINGKVYFSPNPIHHSKVKMILEEARETQNKYNESCKKRKVEKSMKLSEAIKYLKSQGYIIIKPEKTL